MTKYNNPQQKHSNHALNKEQERCLIITQLLIYIKNDKNMEKNIYIKSVRREEKTRFLMITITKKQTKFIHSFISFIIRSFKIHILINKKRVHIIYILYIYY